MTSFNHDPLSSLADVDSDEVAKAAYDQTLAELSYEAADPSLVAAELGSLGIKGRQESTESEVRE